MSNGKFYNYSVTPTIRLKQVKGEVHRRFKSTHKTTLGKLKIGITLVKCDLHNAQLILTFKDKAVHQELINLDIVGMTDLILGIITSSDTLKKARLNVFLNE